MKISGLCLSFCFLAVLIFSNCGEDDDSGDGGGATEEQQTPQTGDQPDPQAGRFTPPTDVTPPALPGAISASTGTKLGEVTLVIAYPEHHDYARLDFRRAEGKTAPADCASGTVAISTTDFSTNTFTDAGLFPGTEYSYRACIYDDADNNISSESLSIGESSATQRLFVTSAQYDGNLKADFNDATFTTGIAGANARCQYHAGEAGLDGTFRALLSHDDYNANGHIPNYGKIVNLAGQQLAANGADLWDGALNSAVLYDETGTAIAEDDDGVWTATNSDGSIYNTASGTCTDWTSTTGNAIAGRATITPGDATPYNWVVYSNSPCTAEYRLYCIEDVESTFGEATITATSPAAGSITTTVTVGDDWGDVVSVEVFRELGTSTANPNCTSSDRAPLERLAVLDGTAIEPIVETGLDEGHYNVYLCGFDAYGNLRYVSDADDITAGTDYLRAFISDGTFDGATMSITDANTECASSATAAGLSGTFKALVSDNVTTAATNIGSPGNVTRQIFDMAGNHAGEYDENSGWDFEGILHTKADGTIVADGTDVWSATNSYGSYYSTSCSDWTTAASGSTGYAGYVGSTPGFSYTQYEPYLYGGVTTNSQTCDTELAVFCVEQNL